MKFQKLFSLFFIVFLSFLLLNPLSAKKDKEAKSYVKVIYFHGDYRCQSCLTIEKFIKEVVKTYFGKELKLGKVKLRVINYDKKENEKYINKYNLFNQALIIIKYKDGKEQSFKDCPKIWELVGDKGKFFKYVKNEVNKYLK